MHNYYGSRRILSHIAPPCQPTLDKRESLNCVKCGSRIERYKYSTLSFISHSDSWQFHQCVWIALPSFHHHQRILFSIRGHPPATFNAHVDIFSADRLIPPPSGTAHSTTIKLMADNDDGIFCVLSGHPPTPSIARKAFSISCPRDHTYRKYALNVQHHHYRRHQLHNNRTDE